MHTIDLSYFSRMSEAAEFTRLALVETHRRGVEHSTLVCALADGAEWNQGFIDWHRPDAVRILDFCHAAEYLAAAGQVVHGKDTPAFQTWFATQRRELKDGDPDRVLTCLEQLPQAYPHLAAPERQVIATSLNYLRTRRDQIDYAAFQRAGYPIGSGAGEACHTYVIECRLKGTGMRWAREQVNPMAALRTLVCNDRWEEGWAQVAAHLRQGGQGSRPARPSTPPPAPAPRPPEHTPPSEPRLPPGFKLRAGTSWRDRPLGKARYRPSSEWPNAKT
ncbi:MAG: hypothetical protein M1546_04420 [Chloroflexi bacterium]|nr:hypothetical protein [Chloroflexota bacterium]